MSTGSEERGRSEPAAAWAPAAAPVEISNRTPRTTRVAGGEWGAVALGAPFVGAGVMTAVLLGREHWASPGHSELPPSAMAALGLCFAITGAALVAHGLRGVARRRGAAAVRRRYPEQPWMWDFAWDRQGGRDVAPAEAGRLLAIAGFLALFLVPLHWIAFASDESPGIFQVVTALFDLLGAVLLARVVFLALRRIRFGASRIRFARFPFAAGGVVEIALDGVSRRARAVPITATLRHVEEREEVRESVGERETRTTSYELWRETRTVAPGAPVVTFAVPAGAPGTALSAHPARYWELELHADLPGVDYRGRFLVPVY